MPTPHSSPTQIQNFSICQPPCLCNKAGDKQTPAYIPVAVALREMRLISAACSCVHSWDAVVDEALYKNQLLSRSNCKGVSLQRGGSLWIPTLALTQYFVQTNHTRPYKLLYSPTSLPQPLPPHQNTTATTTTITTTTQTKTIHYPFLPFLLIKRNTYELKVGCRGSIFTDTASQQWNSGCQR